MLETPYPLPTSTRQTDWLVGDGGTRYGPFAEGWGIFDLGDVLVEVRPAAGGAIGAVECVIEKASSARYASFYVTFPVAITSATHFRVTGLRQHARDLAVTRGGGVDGVMLELELSKQAVVLQEQRRDIKNTLDALANVGVIVPGGEPVPHTHALATPFNDGFMSAANVVKLDAISSVDGVSEDALRATNAAPQFSLVAGYHVIDPAKPNFVYTALAANVFVHAEHIEVGQVYAFSCYDNSTYNMIIDLGLAAKIVGMGLSDHAIELRGGETVYISRVTGNFFYIRSHHANDYTLSDEATFEYRHTGGNYYELWRRVTVSAGITANFGFAAAYQAASVKRVLSVALVNNVAGVIPMPHITGVTDTQFSIHNPHTASVTVDVVIGNLRKENA